MNFTCSDLHGNAGGDWVGDIAGQLGINGNICEDPLFCDAEEGDFTIRDDSPCAPEQNPECGLIGAWPVGCYVAGIAQGGEAAGLLRISGAVPNPFRDATRIAYEIDAMMNGVAHLAIYDAAGRLVRSLVPGEVQHGPREAIWNGRAEDGSRLAGGIYFCRLQQGKGSRTIRLVLIR